MQPQFQFNSPGIYTIGFVVIRPGAALEEVAGVPPGNVQAYVLGFT